MNNTHEGHRQRLRDMSLRVNVENMADHQVLEMLLAYVIPRKDTNPIAHNLINQFGSFSAVLDASKEDLMKVKGIGEKTAQFLTSYTSIYGFYTKDKQKKKHKIMNTSDIIDYIAEYLRTKNNEELYVICINNTNDVMLRECVAQGNNVSSIVDMQKLMQIIFKSKCANAILVHNHPNGSAKPSIADDNFTKTVAVSLGINKINFLDHVIIGRGSYYSYRLNGNLDNYKQTVLSMVKNSNNIASTYCKYNDEV